MAVDEALVRERLSKVFARQDFFEACKRRDAGAIVRILGAHGITQGQVSMMTGIAQSTLSKYKTGGHQAEFASTFEKIADGLGMPQRLRQALGLTGEATPDRPGGATNGVAGDADRHVRPNPTRGGNRKERNKREATRNAVARRWTRRSSSSRAKRSLGTPRLRSH